MPIRTVARLAAVLLIALPAAACYEATQPVGPIADATIDRAFVGTWTCVDPKDPSNRAAVLGGERLFNVQEIDTAHPPARNAFGFVRARIDSSRNLTMAIVEADAVKPKTGADAIRTIRERVSDLALYGPFATCTAQPAPEAK